MGTPTFDIEGIDWVLPVAVGLYINDTYVEFLKTSDEHDVLWEFLTYLRKNYKGIKLFAQNASNYDNKLLLNCLTKHGEKVTLKGGLLYLIWEDIHFQDAKVLTGIGLPKLCEAAEVDRKLEWNHMETSSLFSPSSTRERQVRLDTFSAYLKRDCTSLSKGLDWFVRDFCIGTLGVVPSSTKKGHIPSFSNIALKLFREKFHPTSKIMQNEGYYPMFSQATPGMRNEVYCRYGEDIHIYDTNSQYLSSYDTPMPIGTLLKAPFSEMSIDSGTLAYAKVKVPKDSYIGPLPYDYNGHLIFPVGEFEGLWDMMELRNAVYNHGCDVTLIKQWKCEEEPILKDFAEYIFALKAEAKNEAVGKLLNLLGHRLGNKFGQKRFKTEVKHFSDMKEEDWIGSFPIDDTEVYHELLTKKIEYSRESKWAIRMRILAVARLRHTNLLLDASKKGKIYYCATDSLHTSVHYPTSNKPGELKEVDKAIRAYYIKTNCYGYVNKYSIFNPVMSGYSWDGPGRPIEYDFQKLLKGEPVKVPTKSISGLKDIIRGENLLSKRLSTVKPRSDYPNRFFEGLDSRPIILPEILVPKIFEMAFEEEI